jgi:hypothetical protein
MRRQGVACMAVVLLGFGVPSVLGSQIGVDKKLNLHNKSDPSASAVEPTALTGAVDMLWQGDKLIVTLTNTSGDTGVKGSANLLTGLGFTLPDEIDIIGGSVSMLGSTAINFTAPDDGDVSSEWAYGNSVTGGHFFTATDSSVNTVLSCFRSDARTPFVPDSIDSGSGHNGKDFGLLMQPPSGMSTSDFIGRNPEAIMDTVTFTLNLSGAVAANLVELIDAEPIVLTFGLPPNSISPDSSIVPEPSSLVLLCMVAVGFLLHTRRKRR